MVVFTSCLGDLEVGMGGARDGASEGGVAGVRVASSYTSKSAWKIRQLVR